jgi:Zn-finger nucleic acid-binding protein
MKHKTWVCAGCRKSLRSFGEAGVDRLTCPRCGSVSAVRFDAGDPDVGENTTYPVTIDLRPLPPVRRGC